MSNDNTFSDVKTFLDFVKNESENCLFAELCAMIGQDKAGNIVYRQMQNRSKEPASYFMIDPYDYLQFIKEYRPLGVFHSHLVGSEEPSEFDVKTSENCCLAFLIYSVVTEKFFIYEPRFHDYDVNIVQRIKEAL